MSLSVSMGGKALITPKLELSGFDFGVPTKATTDSAGNRNAYPKRPADLVRSASQADITAKETSQTRPAAFMPCVTIHNDPPYVL